MSTREIVFSRRQILERAGALGVLALGPGVGSLFAQKGPTSDVLSERVLAANRELDRVLLEAHKLKDSDMIRSVFSKSPHVFFIDPSGTLYKGHENIALSFQRWFDGLEYVTGEITDISYIPAGEGVIALGKVTYSRRPKNGTAEKKYVIWTDYRKMENKKWVYLFRHAHWPLASNPPAPR